jgi:hypothetical protein
VLADGKTAVASDPDRDQIYVADTSTTALVRTIALVPGDEPGRLAVDGAGRVHVALRSGHALVTIDPGTGAILGRRDVCPAPRGVAWDKTTDSVWVACATGELVALPAAGGPPTTTTVVERDLRDVLVQAGSLAVSKFRSAELLRLGTGGAILRRDPMPPSGAFVPHVAWRSVTSASGWTVTLHQEHSEGPIPTKVRSSYGSVRGGGIVGARCTVMDDMGAIVSTFPVDIPLAFDVAASRDGSSIAAVGAVTTVGTPAVELMATDGSSRSEITSGQWSTVTRGQPVAVSFDGAGDLVVQTREPATLLVVPILAGLASGAMALSQFTTNSRAISLSTVSRDDEGHDLFHTPTQAQIACASCHPEGGDDGHVWMLDGMKRRTPSLRGTIAGTAPYHWTGDETDFPTLVQDVFVTRMAALPLKGNQMTALTQWVQAIAPPAAPSWVDPVAAARGSVIFLGATAQCTTCHSGPKFTNNQTMDVGTGQAFQVPPLVGVGWRTPLMHDGCARTIADRFGACATPGHGVTSTLSAQDIADLTAFLESL